MEAIRRVNPQVEQKAGLYAGPGRPGGRPGDENAVSEEPAQHGAGTSDGNPASG